MSEESWTFFGCEAHGLIGCVLPGHMCISTCAGCARHPRYARADSSELCPLAKQGPPVEQVAVEWRNCEPGRVAPSEPLDITRQKEMLETARWFQMTQRNMRVAQLPPEESERQTKQATELRFTLLSNPDPAKFTCKTGHRQEGERICNEQTQG